MYMLYIAGKSISLCLRSVRGYLIYCYIELSVSAAKWRSRLGNFVSGSIAIFCMRLRALDDFFWC